MKFTKMHGLGNDYVYVNCFEEKIDNPPAVARHPVSPVAAMHAKIRPALFAFLIFIFFSR